MTLNARSLWSWVLEVGVATGVIIALFNHLHRGNDLISLFRARNLLLALGTVALTTVLSYLVGLGFRRFGLLGFSDDDPDP